MWQLRGTTWIALTLQIDRAAPELGRRAALVAGVGSPVRLLPRARRVALRLPAREHTWLALLGVLGSRLSDLLVYHSRRFIVSGLVAVGDSAAPPMNMLPARAFFGTPMSRRVAAGGPCALAGIARVFSPKFGRLDGSTPLAIGTGLTAGAVLTRCPSNMMVARQQTLGIRGWPPQALAMGYGAAASWLVVLLLGVPLQVRWLGPFAAALLYLALAGARFSPSARIAPRSDTSARRARRMSA